MSVLGQALSHESAREHVRGTATYLDDMPPLPREIQQSRKPSDRNSASWQA